MEPVLGDISVFVEGVEAVHQVYILLDAENVGVVEQVEEQPEETEQDQWDPIVAEEESQQRHFGVDAGDREGNLREGVSNECRVRWKTGIITRCQSGRSRTFAFLRKSLLNWK